MPDSNKMMFIRPKNCHYCGNGYYALGHVLSYANSKGQWSIMDIAAEQANKDQIFSALNEQDPEGIYAFGHGSNTIFTADAELPVFTTEDCSILRERVVYLLSCLTGNLLGPAIIRIGAKAYAGFNISWTWMSDSGTDGDPYEDIYARCFWESANELWIALLDGKSFIDSVQASRNKYDEWIDYWFYDKPEDPNSEDCIMWLAHDRDGLVAYTSGDEIVSEAGMGWIIPVMAIAGFLYYIFRKKQ
jgi:hypothetical protein